MMSHTVSGWVGGWSVWVWVWVWVWVRGAVRWVWVWVRVLALGLGSGCGTVEWGGSGWVGVGLGGQLIECVPG